MNCVVHVGAGAHVTETEPSVLTVPLDATFTLSQVRSHQFLTLPAPFLITFFLPC